jgi:Tfp pilus assembly major pilin PilA
MTRITRSYIAPNPKEFDYWVDLAADPKGNVIKYYAGSSKWLPINDDTDNDQSARIKALELGKVDKVEGKVLSSNDFTNAYKTKLDGITAQANKTIVDNSLTSTSTTNALAAAQGKALKDLIDALTARVAALEAPAA